MELEAFDAIEEVERAPTVNKLLFFTILLLGIYNTLCWVLMYRNTLYFYNSLLLTVIVVSALFTLHYYYILSKDVLLGTTHAWMSAAGLAFAMVVFDYFTHVPSTVLYGDMVIFYIILMSYPVLMVLGNRRCTATLFRKSRYFRRVK